MRVAILLGALATSVHADTNYRLCTCTENKKIAESRSLDITDSSGGKYVISTKVWTGKERAPLEGMYFHDIGASFHSGNVHGDGWITVSQATRLCQAAGAPETNPSAACFTPKETLDHPLQACNRQSPRKCRPFAQYLRASIWYLLILPGRRDKAHEAKRKSLIY
ncbi:predicted protein [Plenodomus lingam JN3]|uniref:Uncharacterized protein n=1 Tax=Leptosphaeria maculans (strain JN3 / isolate v23.1.3 / race Av1-4-5-6-7-8) TaxID=985895 RepID=E5A7M2_LEPMJ|nr:predicted protein [Plenodomus lingam JN3]CBX99617.1 predicted protein [Plenodomus lingam JN3]